MRLILLLLSSSSSSKYTTQRQTRQATNSSYDDVLFLHTIPRHCLSVSVSVTLCYVVVLTDVEYDE